MISNVTTGGLLVTAAARHGERTAVVFPGSREDYAGLLGRAEERGRLLIAHGVEPGDHVGLLMTNSPAYIELLFAIGLTGAVAVPVNSRYRAAELAYVLGDADISLLIVGEPPSGEVSLRDRLAGALPELAGSRARAGLHAPAAPALRRIVGLDGASSAGIADIADIDASAVTAGEVRERCACTRVRDAALIMYTSGTTARPKGAVLSHESVVRTGEALGHDRYRLTPDDVLWDPLPLFHMSGIVPLMAAVSAGAAFACQYRVDAAEALRMMRDERATIGFACFPEIAMDLLQQPGYRAGGLDSLRVVHLVGVPDMLAKVQAAFPGAVQVNAYGCTEAGGLVATSELGDTAEQRTTWSGRPYPGNRIRVLGPDGEPLPAGTPGEIAVRGFGLFEGYYNNPEATAASMDADGWFRTGDLGELSEDGRVRYVSRLKDMLKVGGENVAAMEIESVLCGHPAVAIAAVVAAPHSRLGEVPVAFVELVPGAAVTEDELISHCAASIASFKVPRAVRFTTQWPMSSTKIQKHRLRERLDGETFG
ncbi:MAG: AMP-binding protein [Streptosporangiales bacterium]|nr:AMP-binding protein [Streptosporangiales bacterium]